MTISTWHMLTVDFRIHIHKQCNIKLPLVRKELENKLYHLLWRFSSAYNNLLKSLDDRLSTNICFYKQARAKDFAADLEELDYVERNLKEANRICVPVITYIFS